MRWPMFVLPTLLACASAAGAQATDRWPRPEIRPLLGVYIPEGAMRGAFEHAPMLGAQAALELSRNLHVLGSGSWTYGRSRLPLPATRVNIWQYDVGVEVNHIRRVGEELYLRPFAGLGGGGRTYEFPSGSMPARTCTAGYAALGGELQVERAALRVEARDYLTCFESPITGQKRTRSDIGLTLGIAYHIR